MKDENFLLSHENENMMHETLMFASDTVINILKKNHLWSYTIDSLIIKCVL